MRSKDHYSCDKESDSEETANLWRRGNNLLKNNFILIKKELFLDAVNVCSKSTIPDAGAVFYLRLIQVI